MDFVNLGQAGATLVRAVAHLAALHYGAGRRVLIKAADQAQAQELDETLWTFDPASFLPHSLAGAPEQGQEPVLIALGTENLNQAEVLILADPARPPLKGFEQVVDFVPAGQGPDLEEARRRYRLWQDQGVRLGHLTALP